MLITSPVQLQSWDSAYGERLREGHRFLTSCLLGINRDSKQTSPALFGPERVIGNDCRASEWKQSFLFQNFTEKNEHFIRLAHLNYY